MDFPPIAYSMPFPQSVFFLREAARRRRDGRRFIFLEEDVLEHEQHSQHIHQRLDLLALAGNHVQHHIGDDGPWKCLQKCCKTAGMATMARYAGMASAMLSSSKRISVTVETIR